MTDRNKKKRGRIVWRGVLAGILTGILFSSAQLAEAKENDTVPSQNMTKEWIADYTEEINYEEIQEIMEDILEDTSFDFKTAMEAAVAGEEMLSGEVILQAVIESAGQELQSEKDMVTRLLTIAIIGALFVNFSNIFKSSQVADTGFFVTYLLFFSVLSMTFYSISQTAATALENLLEFMRALLPAYFVAVTFSTGASASLVFYEAAMFLIIVVETVLVKAVIPMVHIYFVVRLANYISKEDYLSKAADLLETIIIWIVRTLLGITVGYNFIQGMVVPAADHLKNSVLLKTAKLIPGVGSAISSVAESVLGAGVLVKNAMGAVGILVIIMIISVPMIKIAFYCILYKLGAAIIQPVSDKRILECLEGAGKGASLLLYMVFAGSALFLLTIAIVMTSTSQIV